MALGLALVAVLIGLAIVLCKLVLESWLRQRCRGRLPPGTMGWPLLGETVHLFSQEPGAFFQGKQKRFGDIFKTHVLGCPAIMVASPEAIKFVMAQDHLFTPTFPSGKERLLGREAIFFHNGDYHMAVRRLALAAFRPEAIRHSVKDVEALAIKCLLSMESRAGETVSAFRMLKDFTFDVAALFILGPHVPEEYMRQLKETYYHLESGYNSFPVNLPGTKFYKSMKARQRLQNILERILAQTDEEHSELLQRFMECEREVSTSKKKLTRQQIIDNMVGLVFAGHGTTASVMTWLLKYLGEHPHVLQAVTAEQQGLVRAREQGQTGLTWLDTRNAPFTARVIQETMRSASILSFTYREAVQDVEFKGYIIPRGWKVMPLFRNMHHNSTLFANPHKFDPSRFESAPKPNSFMPFGQGVHSCLGSEVAKLEMHVFIHHLTTKYRWETSSAEGVTYCPFPLPKDGLPIRIFPKSQTPPPLLMDDARVIC